jgi:hypothetical protein
MHVEVGKERRLEREEYVLVERKDVKWKHVHCDDVDKTLLLDHIQTQRAGGRHIDNVQGCLSRGGARVHVLYSNQSFTRRMDESPTADELGRGQRGLGQEHLAAE